MNTTKSSNYGKLIAFFLIASVLLCILGFAAEGWQQESPKEEINSTDDFLQNNNPSNDIGTGGEAEEQPQAPIFINALTGLETTPLISATRPVSFIVDSSSPIYGLSYADILIEIPTERASTRFMCLTSNYRAIGKIGSLAPTRGFMTNLAAYFGAILISSGTDDTVNYSSTNYSSYHFDISKTSGYYYTEYSSLKYTNGALIEAGIKNSGINSLVDSSFSLPFAFNSEIGECTGALICSTLTLPLSPDSQTELVYSKESGKYALLKNGESRIDLLTDTSLEYDNAFVLFTDCMTYESSNGTELIMDTVTAGLGYYASGGTLQRIQWRVSDGKLAFYDDNGDILSASTGSSYISLIKSSKIESVIFS